MLWNSQKLLDQVSYLHCSGYLPTQHLTKNTSSLFSFSLSPSLLPSLSFSLSFYLFDFVLFNSSFVLFDWNEGLSIILQFSLVLCLWHNISIFYSIARNFAISLPCKNWVKFSRKNIFHSKVSISFWSWFCFLSMLFLLFLQ